MVRQFFAGLVQAIKKSNEDKKRMKMMTPQVTAQNPQPSTLNPQPSTLDPRPSLNPKYRVSV